MAEPRRPVADLPGFGETSISTARPIDAFAGAPQIDKKNALAEAFSNLGKAGQKAAAQAEAKREKERLDLMTVEAEGTARRMIAESETGFINAVQLGEQYADLSDAIVARIVIRENSDAFYNMTKQKLSGLGDGIVMDKAGLDAMYGKLEEEAINATDGFIHAQSGALDGVQRAVQEMSGNHAKRRDGIVRNRAALVTKGQVTTLLNSTSDVTSIVEGLTAIDAEPSPFDNVGRKGLIVDALLEWDKNNPESDMMHQKIIDAVPWLKGAVTDAKVSNAQGAIASNRMSHLRDKAYLQNLANEEAYSTNVASVNAITEGDGSVAEQLAALESLQADMAIAAAKFKPGDADYDAGEVKVANDTWAYIESVKRSLEVPPDVSSANRVKVRTSILSGATAGTMTTDQAIAMVRARDDISPTDKGTLINEIPQLIQGGGIIATESHNTAYRQRVGGSVDAYDKNDTLRGVTLKLSMVGESVDSIAREIWDDTTINLIEQYMEENEGKLPNVRAMREIYDQAEVTVKSRLEELNKLRETAANMSTGQIRDRVDTITDESYDPSQDPLSTQFSPKAGGIYVEPNTGRRKKFNGTVNSENPFDDSNWVYVDDNDNEIVTSSEPVVTDETGTETNTKVSRNKTVAKEQAEEREATAGGYEALGELFNQENQEFNLPEDTLNSLLEQVTNTTLKRRQKDVPESVIKNIILKELGLEGNSYFDFGGLDGANLDGEVAVKKLIEKLQELDQR